MARPWRASLAVLAFVAALGGVAYHVTTSEGTPTGWLRGFPMGTKGDIEDYTPALPLNFSSVLLEKVYDAKTDFRNEKGIVPSFWDEVKSSNDTQAQLSWGPCYPPEGHVNWEKQIERWHGANDTAYHSKKDVKIGDVDVAGYCRPGFIIIGAGKCGTSSLYHYLTGHPRVLPASEKQIHYFKYYLNKPIKWYLSHFPTATSFLSAGALMTGEASPGYMPYPDVAHRTPQMMPGSKIIAIGRNPLERAWSSYNYNYANPLLKSMWQGLKRGIPAGASDELYRNYLFSFEDLLRAELKTLRECFAPDGTGPIKAKKAFGNKEWAKAEFERREGEGLPSLIDIDEHCYGGTVSSKGPRKQWSDLVEKHPDKIIETRNAFLTQALIGRSLYVFPLEWWYITIPREDIYFICTEEMRDMTGDPLNQVGQFLGLPSFDFSNVVAEGMFNVGGHKGYDMATPWEEVQKEHTPIDNNTTSVIPLSEDFRKELLDFIEPYNERLFELVGRRCDWKS